MDWNHPLPVPNPIFMAVSKQVLVCNVGKVRIEECYCSKRIDENVLRTFYRQGTVAHCGCGVSLFCLP